MLLTLHTPFFRGSNNILSNFASAPMVHEGIPFPHSEAVYQYIKLVDQEEWGHTNQMVTMRDPLSAMHKGCEVTGSPRWHTTKIEKMRHILISKARQCPTFVEALLASRNDILVEDTSIELCGCGEFHTGFNMLGKLEMVIRDDIRSGKLHLEN